MNKSIAEKILDLRKSRGLTQEKLGEMLGVSSQAISKWEKGDSLPDILLLPKLCEILGISADALLEVPVTVKKSVCLDGIFEYAKQTDAFRAAYEAICATSYPAERDNGGAFMAGNGVKVHNTDGLALVISSKEMLAKVRTVPVESIGKMMRLVADENVMAVVRVLAFEVPWTEEELAETAGISVEAVESVLFRLLKAGMCECDADGKYGFGPKSYLLFAVLAGCYLASPDGFRDIGMSSRSYGGE